MAVPTVQEYWRYGYYDEIRHFVECLREGRTPMLTFRDGWEVNRIIDQAYASAGREVGVPGLTSRRYFFPRFLEKLES